MGFLKFLKRDRGKEPDLDLGMEDFDVPPLPPGMEEKKLEGQKELLELPELPEMPELPELPKEGTEELPELPEMPELEEEEPIFSIKEEPVPGLDIPLKPAPELKAPSIEAQPRPPRKPLFGMPRPVPTPSMPKPQEEKPKITPYERFERAAVREEKAVLRHKEAEGPIYIRVERFRDILTGTRTIKNNLKTAGQSIVKLDEIDADRDKIFEKWHNVMMDLQKKLIFIDKTLFKR